jgi:hypothetical protein
MILLAFALRWIRGEWSPLSFQVTMLMVLPRSKYQYAVLKESELEVILYNLATSKRRGRIGIIPILDSCMTASLSILDSLFEWQ